MSHHNSCYTLHVTYRKEMLIAELSLEYTAQDWLKMSLWSVYSALSWVYSGNVNLWTVCPICALFTWLQYQVYALVILGLCYVGLTQWTIYYCEYICDSPGMLDEFGWVTEVKIYPTCAASLQRAVVLAFPVPGQIHTRWQATQLTYKQLKHTNSRCSG